MTPTGRKPSTPPLQNIPVRTELGRELRRVFVGNCYDRTCCARWREIGMAYSEGRKEEAAREATRTLREQPALTSCRIGARVVEAMRKEGWFPK